MYTAHSKADALSRIPLLDTSQATPLPAETVLLMEQMEAMPVTAAQVKSWTHRDPILFCVFQFVQCGWPNYNNFLVMDKAELMPYWGKRWELSCHDGCQLWGNRVMITTPGQTDVLHEAHPGSTRMKSLAHTFVWQPGIDKDIEVKVVVRNARMFNLHLASSLEVGSLALGLGHMLIWQDHSWVTRFSLLMHTESGWKLIHFSSTSTSIIQCLHRIFSTFDLTEVLVTDNSPDFVSKEFDPFLGRKGVNTQDFS